MVRAKVWALVSLLTWPLWVGAISERVGLSAEAWGRRLGGLWPARAAERTNEGDAPSESPPHLPPETAPQRQAHAGEVRGEQQRRRVSDAPNAVARATEPPRRERAAAPAGIRLSRRRVLQLARARAVPRATPTAATSSRPSGLLLRGVSRLGIGVRDGDVLSHVSGVPVSSVGQVASLVMQARARKEAVVQATLWRGAQSFPLVVEMPYSPAAPAASPAAPAASPAPPANSSARGDLRTPPIGLGNGHGPNRQMHQTPSRAGGAG